MNIEGWQRGVCNGKPGWWKPVEYTFTGVEPLTGEQVKQILENTQAWEFVYDKD